MFRRYLLTGLAAGFLSISSTLYAGESEIILKDNTTASGLTVKEETANTTIARFRGDGNVGIGTASPDAELSIQAGSGQDGSTITFKNNTGTSLASINSWNSEGGRLDFAVGTSAVLSNTPHMVITTSGNVGIGTTAPAQKLMLFENTVAATQEISMYGTVNTVHRLAWAFGSKYLEYSQETGSILFANASASDFVIKNTGNVGIGTASPQHPLHMGSGAHVTTGGVWTNASSREYKENIRDLTVDDAMQALDGLRPSRFNYKVDDEDEYVGFIAEDVPELVATRDRKGLSPMDLTAVITKVVQEQQRMLQDQKETIDAMKHEIEILKTGMNYGAKGL